MPTYAHRENGRIVEKPVTGFDQCDREECEYPWQFEIRVNRALGALDHPSIQGWDGLLVCFHHARVARAVAERYGLPLTVARVRR
jgi:hypothetical protein